MPVDLDSNLKRARWSLDGLSVGDAFGDSLFFSGHSRYALHSFAELIEKRVIPPHRWGYTDDTQMALSIVEVLHQHHEIDQDALAQSFAHRFDHKRGYGPAMYRLLPQLQHSSPNFNTDFRARPSIGNKRYINLSGERFCPLRLEQDFQN